MMKNKENFEDFKKNEENLVGYLKLIEEATERKKKTQIKEMDFFGEELASEMEERAKKETKKKEETIRKILEFDTDLTFEELMNWTYRDVFIYHKKLEHKNRGFFQKLKDLLTKK